MVFSDLSFTYIFHLSYSDINDKAVHPKFLSSNHFRNGNWTCLPDSDWMVLFQNSCL